MEGDDRKYKKKPVERKTEHGRPEKNELRGKKWEVGEGEGSTKNDGNGKNRNSSSRQPVNESSEWISYQVNSSAAPSERMP